ncbi:MAG: cytochrome c [Candidatus Baltobacteraceae bacterium]
MILLRGLLAGALLVLGLFAIGGFAAVKTGAIPANADAPPPHIERWAAKTSLHALLARVPAQSNPLPGTDANLSAGVKLYGQNCAVCHGDRSARPTNIARGLYVRAPQLARFGVEDDPDAVTYWKIAHGLRWTGMPAFGASLSVRELWQLTAFLKTMDHLPPGAEKLWRRMRVDVSATAPWPPKISPQTRT